MTSEFGKIEIAPKIVYWVEMPINIPKALAIDLLKKDILIVPISMHEISKYKKKADDVTFFLFNIDEIFTKVSSYNDRADKIKTIKDFINMLTEKFSGYSVVHTSTIDPEISKLFKKSGIFYLERNVTDVKVSEFIIYSIFEKIYKKDNQKYRLHVRLQYNKDDKIEVEVRKIGNRSKYYSAYLLDLSLSGAGIQFLTANVVNDFTLKEFIELNIKIPSFPIRVSSAIIMRKVPGLAEIGLFWDINKSDMIKKDSASNVSAIILKFIQKKISSIGTFGDITSDKKENEPSQEASS